MKFHLAIFLLVALLGCTIVVLAAPGVKFSHHSSESYDYDDADYYGN